MARRSYAVSIRMAEAEPLPACCKVRVMPCIRRFSATCTGYDMIQTQDRELILNVPIFRGLSEEILQPVLAHTSVQYLGKNVLLFHQGTPTSHFYIVLEGWVKVFRETALGQESVLGLFTRGEACAVAAIFDQACYPASAMTVEPSRLAAVAADPFLKLIRNNGDIAFNVLGDFSRRLRRKIQQLEQLNALPTYLRLAQFLLEYAGEEDGRLSIQLPVDKSLIAARLGMKPESFSRALARLRPVGVRTCGRTVEVEDRAALKEFAYDEVLDQGQN